MSRRPAGPKLPASGVVEGSLAGGWVRGVRLGCRGYGLRNKGAGVGIERFWA